MSEPTTSEEWQTCVDAANALLVMQTAVDRGWITFDGSMTVRVARAREMLERGAALGYRPNIAAVETLARGFDAGDAGTELLLSIAREARA